MSKKLKYLFDFKRNEWISFRDARIVIEQIITTTKGELSIIN